MQLYNLRSHGIDHDNDKRKSVINHHPRPFHVRVQNLVNFGPLTQTNGRLMLPTENHLMPQRVRHVCALYYQDGNFKPLHCLHSRAVRAVRPQAGLCPEFFVQLTQLTAIRIAIYLGFLDTEHDPSSSVCGGWCSCITRKASTSCWSALRCGPLATSSRSTALTSGKR